MDGVLVAPAVKRREHDHPAHDAHPPVGGAAGEERAVRAVVEDDEGAQQEAGGRHGQRQHEQIGDLYQRVCGRSQREVRNDGGGEVQQATPDAWLGIRRQAFSPEGRPQLFNFAHIGARCL